MVFEIYNPSATVKSKKISRVTRRRNKQQKQVLRINKHLATIHWYMLCESDKALIHA